MPGRMPQGGRVVIAVGELTGHAHDFDAEDVQLFWQKGRRGRSFLKVAADAELRHEEYASSISVTNGRYELRRQREYA